MTETMNARQIELAQMAEIAPIKVYWSKPQKRYVAKSLEVAQAIGHTHYNLCAAVEKTEEERPDLKGEFVWSTYTTRTGRECRCCSMSKLGMLGVFERIRSVKSCRQPRAVLVKYIREFDGKANGQHAEPAPDSEIKPPNPEPKNLFDVAPTPIENPAASWEINAAIKLLRTRSGLPRYLSDDLHGWNTDRRKALLARTTDDDEIQAIFANEKPE